LAKQKHKSRDTSLQSLLLEIVQEEGDTSAEEIVNDAKE